MEGIKLLSNKYVRLVVILRIAGYFTILWYPLEGILLSMFLDILDWYILSWGGVPRSTYHKVDKPIDYIQYLFMIPPILSTPIFPTYMLFLIWRTIGHLVYYKTGKRAFFILFPNVAEYIAIVYFISERYGLGVSANSLQVILIIIIFKIVMEVWLHYFAKGSSYDWGRRIRAFLYPNS